MIEWKHYYSNKNSRENYLKAVEFRNPEWIPCSISIFTALRIKYGSALEDIITQHPFIFGKYKKGAYKFMRLSGWEQPNSYHIDNWGCKWHIVKGGYEGQVIEHPLSSWEALDTYQPPDPLKFSERGRRHWRGMKIAMKFLKKKGVLCSGSGERLFDRMYFLRGFENLMIDIARDNPNLVRLTDMLTNHELKLINKWLEMRVDQISFHTDIGMQNRLMIHPNKFRKFIKPMFKTLFQTCRQNNSHVYLSSDGYLLDIVDDLIECGVSVHDPQERANTLEGIAKCYKGRLCIDLDLDRQLLPFAKPEQLKRHIKTAIDTLNSPEGGFMMKCEFSDENIPLENIAAVAEAFEEYCFNKR